MDSNTDMENLIEDLEMGAGDKKEEAAVKIAKSAASGNGSVRAAVPQLKKALHSDDPHRLHWKTASALAEIAHRYPENVKGIEERLIDILKNEEDDWCLKYSILALTALESEKGLKKIEEVYNSSDNGGVQNVCRLSMLTIPSEYEVRCGFQHVKIVVTKGSRHLQKLMNEKTVTTPSQDCLAALALLVIHDDKESRIHIVDTARNEPAHFEKVLSTIGDGFNITELWGRHYALFALAEYSKHDPDRVANIIWKTVSEADVVQGTVDRISESGNVIIDTENPSYTKADKLYVSSSEVNIGKIPTQIDEDQIMGKVVKFVYAGGSFGLLVDEEFATNRYIMRQVLKRIYGLQFERSRIEEIRQSIDFDKISTEPKAQQRQTETPTENAHDEFDIQSTATEKRNSEVKVDQLRKKAEKNAVEEVPADVSTTTAEKPQYNRSSEVREYVKARADGHCEGCGELAPFTSKTGEPYLHAHHIHELSDGGSDTPDTVIALCPNCHYRVHHGEDGDEYNQELLEAVQMIEN